MALSASSEVSEVRSSLFARIAVALARPRGAGADPQHRWTHRFAWSTAAILLYFVGWYLIGWLVTARGFFVDVSLPIDERIPLRVGFAWGYAVIFLLIAVAIVFIRDGWIYRTACQGVIVQTLIAFVFFVLMPVRMDLRPDALVHSMEGPSAVLTSFFYFVDPPLNCFPSMHLALGIWSGLMLIEDRPRWRWPVWALIVWIGVSVLFVRQHYLLDVVAGTTLALLTRKVAFRRRE